MTRVVRDLLAATAVAVGVWLVRWGAARAALREEARMALYELVTSAVRED